MDETTPLSNDLSVAGERSHPLVWEGLILSPHYSLNLWSRWSLRGRGEAVNAWPGNFTPRLCPLEESPCSVMLSASYECVNIARV